MSTPFVVLLIGLAAVAAGAAQPIKVTDAKDQQIFDSFLVQVATVPQTISREHCKEMAEEDAEETEAMTWRAMPYLRMPLTAYRITGDPKYLDVFVQTFENMRSALTKGPDGFLGWYGKTDPDYRDPKDPDRRIDAIISNFSTADTVCDFLALVAVDSGLSTRYATKRAEYLDLIENHLVKKHDVRGDYVDMGEKGAIYRMPPSGLRADTQRLTLPHNKHSIIVRGLLALYRVTGKDEYMRKATKIGSRFKRCLTLKDGHYEWNYWDPAGEWDISTETPNKWKHWIGPEHRGGYYSSSLAQAVALYQHGLVFGETDIGRFVRTQLDMCWNGDLVNPQSARVDGTRPPKYTQGEYIASSLASFNEKVAEYLFDGGRQEHHLKRAGDSWQGGPVINGWLREKLIDYPAAKGGKQVNLGLGKQFLAEPDSSALVKALAFEVVAPGYQSPATPAEAGLRAP